MWSCGWKVKKQSFHMLLLLRQEWCLKWVVPQQGPPNSPQTVHVPMFASLR